MNPQGRPGKIEAIANVATTIAAVLLSVVLVKVYILAPRLAHHPPPSSLPSAAVGTNLGERVSDVDWRSNGRTLVLAISAHCHFCTESAPFFRKLNEQTGRSLKIVALLPESVSDGKEYLSSQGVHVDQVTQVSLGAVGVDGTPTMFLVDSGGVVRQLWVGKLNPEEQGRALDVLQGATGERQPPADSPDRKRGG